MDFKHPNPFQGGSKNTIGGAVLGTAIGGPLGGVMGAQFGQNQDAQRAQEKATNQQQAAFAADLAARKQQVGQIGTLFGDINSAGDKGKATLAHGQFAGQIEGQAQNVRDISQQGLLAGAQQHNAAIKGALASRGLLGSSLEQSAKQSLLGTYLGGRAATAGATEGTRIGGWNTLTQERQGLQNLALQGGNIMPQIGAMGQASMLGQALRNIPITAFGNQLAIGGQLIGQASMMAAQGGQGLQAFGGSSTPSLALSPATGTRVQGASISPGY